MLILNTGASASSSFNFGVEAFQFSTCVSDFELPIDAPLLGVGFLRLDREFGLQLVEFPDAATL